MNATKSLGLSNNVHCWGGAGQKQGLNAAEKQLVKAAVQTVTAATKLVTAELNLLAKTTGAQSGAHCGCDDVSSPSTPSAPSPGDSSHPAGSLKTDDKGVVTTPGGYKIEATEQFNWKITGPDGKETKIWGDPHVSEGDGGEWQFKRDSTFVLGDGTRINVSCKPYGNGATVTGNLDIISGNDRVQITDIDQGKGKTGKVTQDGFQHVNDFGGKDVFVMGKETDDWSFTGKEVVGSENQGETFKLGNELAAGGSKPTEKPTTKPTDTLKQFAELFRSLSSVFDVLKGLGSLLNNRSSQNTGIVPQQQKSSEPVEDRRRNVLQRSFEQIGRMLDTVARFQKLSHAIEASRNQRFVA
ncbi:DUF1521 domain-containing protein [Hyalangium versicolor]|uniref:DUF1521 domain-containing protein n=1 Tax=Hyalangium versicolor TaxID=2861190 RepID=UPI001CCA05E2|nr:DUF1521 domain-containing protein [Hyalangium versicolor]